MPVANPNAFVGSPLNRVGVERKDEAWCAAQLQHQDLRLLPSIKGEPLLNEAGSALHLAWLTIGATQLFPKDQEMVLLGLKDGAPYFATDASAIAPQLDGLGLTLPLREAAMRLPAEECAMAGHAAWVLDWHRRNRFCARFGHPTVMAEAGAKRINMETGTEHFPRCDPVAIMLATHGEHCCLGRNPKFPPGYVSAMAGYVEACETLEECAARELYEEVGLSVTDIQYVFSQPWPFPSSLMMGFIAEVKDRKLTLDPTEITDAYWVSRDEARELIAGKEVGGLRVPPPLAIAHQLIKVWVER